jgi:hypothetical protein
MGFRSYLSVVTGLATFILPLSFSSAQESTTWPRRFFPDNSFWNTPIPANAAVDPRSDHYIKLLRERAKGSFVSINLDRWTIPLYEAGSTTPRHKVKQRTYTADELRAEGWSKFIRPGIRLSHGAGFGTDVPIPDDALPDPERDGHIAIIDWSRMLAWDMWDARKLADGTWESSTGMVYPLNGNGIFRTKDFAVKTNESIHFYGPSRAAGVPAIAGLIMRDEVLAGEIRHKLSACTPVNAKREFVFPACWTDGHWEGGIPEGAVIQLDPDVALDQFNLLPGELAVAKALQRYGVVDVDNGGGFAIYAEGLYGHPGRSWEGLLTSGGIGRIPSRYFRVLKLGGIVYDGH